MARSSWRVALGTSALFALGCVHASARVPAPSSGALLAPVGAPLGGEQPRAPTQLVVVTTPAWDSVSGTLRRYTRESAQERWRAVGSPIPVVVGRSGLGWGVGAIAGDASGPRKQEGDGRAPAGLFPLDTAFGFAPASSAGWVRLAYFPLRDASECVDDGASRYYNTVVNRDVVSRVDWTSAEQMRRIGQYRLGVIVGYNAAPRVSGAGSCIFLHIWAGPGMPTNGCTAMPEQDLNQVVLWLDRARHPVLVQLPEREYARLRESWRLP